MKQNNDFNFDMLDLDQFPGSEVWIAGQVDAAEESGDGKIALDICFVRMERKGGFHFPETPVTESLRFTLECLDQGILRFTNCEKQMEDSPMIKLSETLNREKLVLSREKGSYIITDGKGGKKAEFNLKPHDIRFWSDQIPAPFPRLTGRFYPDGKKEIPFSSWDQFIPGKLESIPLGYIKRNSGESPTREWLFSFYASQNEAFYGTGERFHSFNLRGQTVNLENTDALGVNNRRAYKNIPFYLSSAGYGLFIHSSAHIRLSLADISTRAAQGLVEDDTLDLFIIGGESPERILHGYRKISGFPGLLPKWSFGTWMSRMTYFSDQEITDIFTRMRDEEYPCDMIHIDTGWFAKDWVCEWTFSDERFPDPADFMKRMREMGYRVSLWQTPNIGKGNRLLEEAKEKKYLAPVSGGAETASDFSGQDMDGQIDFTNPDAVDWYKGMLKKLFDFGASVIKTDFGEDISPDADYHGLPARLLHNLYALLYQKAAFEATEEYYGEGIIWARSAWAGSQRYPLHWGGDAAATFDGMAASLTGGLQLGLSGFSYWSHDVPGFHGVPDFMNSMPDEELYIRWTQFGVLSSHLRYHGTCAREPWDYPGVSGLVKQWLRLRYALIPYLLQQSLEGLNSGFPLLRAMLFHYPEDPACREIRDQYFLGSHLLVAPVMNRESVRNVYLPSGQWTDFWTGEVLDGSRWLTEQSYPLGRIPLYVKFNEAIPFYPEAVSCTDEMTGEARTIIFDEGYTGYRNTFLGTYIDL